MRLSVLKSTLVRGALGLALGALSMAASAGFVLLPNAGSVLPGGTFNATLRYQDVLPMDFGFQFELSSSALGGLRLDSVGLATGSPVDAGLGGLAVGPTPAVALGTPVRVSALLNPAAMPDWTAGVNLLTLSFTLGSGAPGTPFTLTAGNGKATIDFVEDESWTASASLDVARQVPEGGTLVSVLIALGVLGWVQRRRG
jgi:hypothetical protein